ncbi:MAG: hypothetical protein J6M20_09585 [Clostridia bacterium]|nr:hypothetical protein [Clostridia bacterium]
MKRRLGLVFVLLLLLVCWCSTAMAVENSYGVEIHPVAEDKYTYSVPDGLKATLSKSGNVLNVHVNSAASDWTQLLVNGSANCGLEGTAPAGETVTGCYSLGCSLATKEDADSAIDFMEWMIADWQSDVTTWTEGVDIGSFDAEHALFMPRSTSAENPDTLLFCWINSADPSYRYYEWIDIVISNTADKAFAVPYRNVLAETFEPCDEVITTNKLIVSDMQDGYLEYTILSDEAVNEQPMYALRFKAPAGAVRATLNTQYSSIGEVAVENGTATFYDVESLDPTSVREHRFTLVWYGSNGKVVDYGNFTMQAILNTDEICLSKVADFHPVPANRLSVKNGSASAGIEYTYDDDTGILHATHDGKIFVSGEVDRFLVMVTPPEGATHYRVACDMGIDSLYGSPDMFVESVDFNITFNTPDVYSIDEPCYTWTNSLLYPVQAETSTVYLQSVEASRYRGGAGAVYWYASQDDAENHPENFLRREYVLLTADKFLVEEYTDMVADEALITSPVKKVVCIGKKPWKLKVLHHPQKGERTRHYELQMINDTGAPQGLTEPVVFYMPYPEDIAPDKKYDYELLHFESNYWYSTKVEVTTTPYGLRFEVSSLSPFVISYDEVTTVTPTPEPTATPAPTATATPTATLAPTAVPTATPTATPKPIDVPKTGDNSPLALLSLLAVLSLAGLALLGKAKRDNL